MKQYYNVSIYCNIYYCNTIQYGLREISLYCTLQCIGIYCNVCSLNVVNAQLLHHKNDWTSRNLDHTLEVFTFYTVIQVVYSSLYCQNPYSHIKCLFTRIQSNITIWQYIAICSNTICNMALNRIVSPLVTSIEHKAVYL